jgi:hypothetical protein
VQLFAQDEERLDLLTLHSTPHLLVFNHGEQSLSLPEHRV